MQISVSSLSGSRLATFDSPAHPSIACFFAFGALALSLPPPLARPLLPRAQYHDPPLTPSSRNPQSRNPKSRSTIQIHNPDPDPRQKTGPRSENQESALNNQDRRSIPIECGDSEIGGLDGEGWEGKRGGGVGGWKFRGGWGLDEDEAEKNKPTRPKTR